jgi:hypothetical protein
VDSLHFCHSEFVGGQKNLPVLQWKFFASVWTLLMRHFQIPPMFTPTAILKYVGFWLASKK